MTRSGITLMPATEHGELAQEPRVSPQHHCGCCQPWRWCQSRPALQLPRPAVPLEMFTAFAFGVGSVTGGIQGDPSLVEQIQTWYRLSTSDGNQQTVHKTMKAVGEFALSALRETPCFTEKTADCGIRQNWVCTLTLLFTLWPWTEFLKFLIFNVLVWVIEQNHTFSPKLY